MTVYIYDQLKRAEINFDFFESGKPTHMTLLNRIKCRDSSPNVSRRLSLDNNWGKRVRFDIVPTCGVRVLFVKLFCDS